MNKLLLPSLLLVVDLVPGCVKKQIDNSFSQVQQNAQQRLGVGLLWNRDAQAEQKMADTIQSLLADDLTADTAVHIALINNRRLQATYSDVGIASAQLVEAWLIENPVVTTQIRFIHDRPIWEIDAVQNFLEILLLPLAVNVAEAELEATKMRVSAEVIDVAMNTRRTFYRYQARLQLLSLWQSVLTAAGSAYEMAVQLRKAGNISELTLAREQAIYERLKLDVAEVDLAAIQDRERLNILMGLWGEATRWKAVPHLPDMPEAPFDTADLEKKAIENSLDLRAALYNITAQAQQLGLQSIQAAIPQLQLGGAVESDRPTEYRLNKIPRNNETDYKLKERTIEEWQAGPLFSVPIPIWNLGQAAYGAAEMELLRRWNLYTALAIDIRAAARANGYRLATARQRVEFCQKVFVPAWNDVFEQTHLQYNAMFVGVFDLLRAKEDQLQAGQQYVSALDEYWLAQTDLEQLLLGSAQPATGLSGGQSGLHGGQNQSGEMQATFQMVQQQGQSREGQQQRN